MDQNVTDDHMAAIIAGTDQAIVHNDYSRDLLCRAVPAATGKVAVVGHGSFIGQFPEIDRATARATLGLAPDDTVLLFFGNQRSEKGLDIILKALRPFRNRTGLVLLVAGKIKAADEAHVRAAAQEAQVEHLVRFDFGHIGDDRVPAYYRAASVVLLPYRRVYESGVALMAMSFARPVITSDIPVFTALIEESRAGVTARNNDPESLSEQIGKVLDGRLDPEAMGARALDYASNERSWRESGRKMVAALWPPAGRAEPGVIPECVDADSG
jgi:glycosyltransferase involved in cell wall biosynthesis